MNIDVDINLLEIFESTVLLINFISYFLRISQNLVDLVTSFILKYLCNFIQIQNSEKLFAFKRIVKSCFILNIMLKMYILPFIVNHLWNTLFFCEHPD